MLCVGLDTDFAKIPDFVKAGRTVNEAVLEFNKRIIDATAPHSIAFKPNLAFYECLGVDGMAILDKTVEHIRSNPRTPRGETSATPLGCMQSPSSRLLTLTRLLFHRTWAARP